MVMRMNDDWVALLVLCMYLLWSLSYVDCVIIKANTNNSNTSVNTCNTTIIDASTSQWRLHEPGGISLRLKMFSPCILKIYVEGGCNYLYKM